jgi:septum formation protein
MSLSLPLILASISPYRAALLQRLGRPFTIAAPEVDERQLVSDATPPEQASVILATAKARSVAARHPEAIVIGGDQMAADEQGVLHKPGTHDRAIEQLKRLRGRTHYLYTAMTIIAPGQEPQECLDVTALTMASVSDAFLEQVVAADQPYDCAGAYKIEGNGIGLFDSITSQDHTAITGLALLTLAKVLRQFDGGSA